MTRIVIDRITILRSTSYGRAGRINRMVLGGITDSIAWQTVLNVSGINRYWSHNINCSTYINTNGKSV